MILKNNRWYDDNNNSWSSDIETEKSAEAKSKTLIDCRGCRGCSDCSGCSGCSGCIYCSGCSGCIFFSSNPQRYVSAPIGSRNDQTTVYWLKGDVQVICGCFRGDLNQFEDAVRATHDNNVHGQAYQKYIIQCWSLICE